MSFCEHEWTLLCISEILQNFTPMLSTFSWGKKTRPASKNRFFSGPKMSRCKAAEELASSCRLAENCWDGDHHWDVARVELWGFLRLWSWWVLKVMVIHYHPTCFNMFSELDSDNFLAISNVEMETGSTWKHATWTCHVHGGRTGKLGGVRTGGVECKAWSLDRWDHWEHFSIIGIFITYEIWFGSLKSSNCFCWLCRATSKSDRSDSEQPPGAVWSKSGSWDAEKAV